VLRGDMKKGEKGTREQEWKVPPGKVGFGKMVISELDSSKKVIGGGTSTRKRGDSQQKSPAAGDQGGKYLRRCWNGKKKGEGVEKEVRSNTTRDEWE